MATDQQNVLPAVTTLNRSSLGILENINPLTTTASKEFENFETIKGQLGISVNIRRHPRAVVKDGLVADTSNGIAQEFYTLQVGGYDQTGAPAGNNGTYDQYGNTCAGTSYYKASSEDLIYNFNANNIGFMNEVAYASTAELGASIERSLGQRLITGTYLFWGAGIDANNNIVPINTYKQLVDAKMTFSMMGQQSDKYMMVLPHDIIPNMVNTNLSQFVTRRNEEEAQSWEIGDYANISLNVSNLLPTHTAGDFANEGVELTVVSVKTDTNGGVTGFVCSGAGTSTSATALRKFDLGYITTEGLNFVTFVGHVNSKQIIKFQVTSADAPASGNIEFNIYPTLYADPATPGGLQNINAPIVAGVKMKFVPSHSVGILMNMSGVNGSNSPLYMAMPRLPTHEPYPTSSLMDPRTKLSMKAYYGARFENEEYGYVQKALWGSMLASHLATRIILPISSGSDPYQQYVTNKLSALEAINAVAEVAKNARATLSAKK